MSFAGPETPPIPGAQAQNGDFELCIFMWYPQKATVGTQVLSAKQFLLFQDNVFIVQTTAYGL